MVTGYPRVLAAWGALAQVTLNVFPTWETKTDWIFAAGNLVRSSHWPTCHRLGWVVSYCRWV